MQKSEKADVKILRKYVNNKHTHVNIGCDQNLKIIQQIDWIVTNTIANRLNYEQIKKEKLNDRIGGQDLEFSLKLQAK